ncbi:MAG: glucosyl transferase family 2 [Verrucomicrobia bacterium]|nr:glucosyl transferase family 2 [Verrucomicrobiota bacterium]
MEFRRFDPAQLDSSVTFRRRLMIFSSLVIITVPAAVLMGDLHWRTGFDGWKIAHLVIFTLLFGLLALGALQALVGFFLRRQGGDDCRIAASVDWENDADPLPARTALVMPICNEDATRVMEGVRAIFKSVVAEARLENFDFFVLSDSSDPNCWIAEEVAWANVVRELGAENRLFYRKRRQNTNKKVGNIADFCRRWGADYRYMVVLDADSIMRGKAVGQLVRMMERNPGVGLIQTVPRLVNGETIFARLQQFASRLYGPLFTEGLNFWQLSEANYWGHNAIVRVAPFIEFCSLPELPGDGPFGGRIMSHDYVEAALMRRAGWQVWLAVGIDGSFEECPANLIDFAKRDRRWLQGNLQHTRLVIAPGFHLLNRTHFALGILSYLASPLWLTLLILSSYIVYRFNATGLTSLPVDSFAEHLSWRIETQAVLLFTLTLGLLFLPKFLAILDLRACPADLAAFGGWKRVWSGVLAETVLFTLLAPVLMLFHTKFIVLTLCRTSVDWKSQRRGRAGQSEWRESIHVHAGQTLLGFAWAGIAWWIDPVLAAWMSPILIGFMLSIPVSYLTGSVRPGLAAKRAGLLQTPEESHPWPPIVELHERIAHRAPAPDAVRDQGLSLAVLDPVTNAIHLSLLRMKKIPDASEAHFRVLREKLLREGPAALTPRDKLSLLRDAGSMQRLHREVWSAPARNLATWWQQALQEYDSHHETEVPHPFGLERIAG